MQNKTERGNMTKEKRLTLNSDKRKVIADQFQSFYEDKVKQKLIDAKEQYNLMREKAKEMIDSMFNDQLLKLMMRVKSIKHKMKFM